MRSKNTQEQNRREEIILRVTADDDSFTVLDVEVKCSNDLSAADNRSYNCTQQCSILIQDSKKMYVPGRYINACLFTVHEENP